MLDLHCPLGEPGSGAGPTCMPDCDYDWLDELTGFNNDAELDGLNVDLHDGLVFWQGLTRLPNDPPNNPPVVDADGLCLLNLRFEVLDRNAHTPISILETYGDYSMTQIFDSREAGINVAGAMPGPLFLATHDDATVTAELELEGPIGASSESVTVVLHDCDDQKRQDRVETVFLQDGLGTLVLDQVKVRYDWLSVQPSGWLRRSVPLTIVGGQAQVAMTGAERLLAGDINGDDFIDGSRLRFTDGGFGFGG